MLAHVVIFIYFHQTTGHQTNMNTTFELMSEYQQGEVARVVMVRGLPE